MYNLKILVVVLLFAVTLLSAKEVETSFHLSTKTPYEKEAVLLEVNLTQVDHAKVMLFEFSLANSPDYEFHQIQLKEFKKYHNLQHHYLYLIYPKKSGEVLVKFNFTTFITDDDKVAYSISGDRDHVKGLEKEDVVVKLAPLKLAVKPLPMGVDLVGDFSLTHTLDKKETKAYDPVNLKVVLKGKGFLKPFELLKPTQAYRIFTQPPKLKTLHTKKGSYSSLEWEYALSAKESFVLPKVRLKAFNPQTKKVYALGFPSYAIKVHPVQEEALLDKVDAPKSAKGIDWNFWSRLFSYVVVFVAGFLMPRDLFQRKKVMAQSREDMLQEKIKEAKSHRALLKILLLEDASKFKDAIETLESVVYNGKKIPLSQIKDSLRR
jgi:hypothetical protein